MFTDENNVLHYSLQGCHNFEFNYFKENAHYSVFKKKKKIPMEMFQNVKCIRKYDKLTLFTRIQ